MIRPITKYGAVVLEKPGAPVTKFDDELRKLCDDMFESMYAAQGVGLAAPARAVGLCDHSFDGEVRLGHHAPERGNCELRSAAENDAHRCARGRQGYFHSPDF